ncbi:MAP kinase-activating death domain protein [Armadillidium nasatum]|uniref:MAP kinase-activating death domain protein n=1 Tax=Armadillidium nasatum TaxID=96803 RepID=A0A5N5TMW3_9CRUS|nr:MAP kinase-activating death domain protein [Armadillidium nasatum]
MDEALSSMSTQTQREYDKVQSASVADPRDKAKLSLKDSPLIYGNDVDSVDIATRVAMVKFLNSQNLLANFTEHTRTLRLYPRPVVAFQINSFLRSRPRSSPFLNVFARTQAVEFLAEWSLTPNNMAFLRVNTGVTDPVLIGDKPKWYARSLDPVYFTVWQEGSSLGTTLKTVSEVQNPPTDESGSDSDGGESTSSSYSSLSDFVCEMRSSDLSPSCRDTTSDSLHGTLSSGLDPRSVFHPPSCLQIPGAALSDSAPSHRGSISTSSSHSSISSGDQREKDKEEEEEGEGIMRLEDAETLMPITSTGLSLQNLPLRTDLLDKGEEALSPDDDSATTTPKTVISSTHSPLPHISPTQSFGSDISIGAASEKERPITPRMRTLSKGASPTPQKQSSLSSMLARASSIGSGSSGSGPTRQGSQSSLFDSFTSSAKELIKDRQNSQEASFLSQVDKLTEQFRSQVTEKLEVVKQSSSEDGSILQHMDKAKKAAEEAGKSMSEASKQAYEASKTASHVRKMRLKNKKNMLFVSLAEQVANVFILFFLGTFKTCQALELRDNSKEGSPPPSSPPIPSQTQTERQPNQQNAQINRPTQGGAPTASLRQQTSIGKVTTEVTQHQHSLSTSPSKSPSPSPKSQNRKISTASGISDTSPNVANPSVSSSSSNRASDASFTLSNYSYQSSTSSPSSSSILPSPSQNVHPTSSKDFLSNVSSELNDFAQQTSSLFTDIFGGNRAGGGRSVSPSYSEISTSSKARERSQPFGPFPKVLIAISIYNMLLSKGRKGLVEKSSLIRHSISAQRRAELNKLASMEQRASTTSENQAFLKDVLTQVIEGEGIGWLKQNRVRKLMEDESYRTLVVSGLNRTLDRKIGPDDHIDDVCIKKPVWKGMLKLLEGGDQRP